MNGAARDEIVLRYFQQRGMHYADDGSGALIARLEPEDGLPDMRLLVACEAAGQPFFVIQVHTLEVIQRDEWFTVMVACNSWNARTRLPKAFLLVEDFERAAEGVVVLEGCVPADPETSQQAFEAFADGVVAGGRVFWKARRAAAKHPSRVTAAVHDSQASESL